MVLDKTDFVNIDGVQVPIRPSSSSSQSQHGQGQRPVVITTQNPPSLPPQLQQSTLSSSPPRRQLDRRSNLPVVARDNSTVRRKATRSKAGRRRVRRYENGMFLRTLSRRLADYGKVESDDLEDLYYNRDVDRSELRARSVVPISQRSSSAFEPLFRDPELRDLWHEFDEMEMDAQHSKLNESHHQEYDKPSLSSHHLTQSSSPSHCFMRIDKKIRILLRKSRIPTILFRTIEETIETAYETGESEIEIEADSFGRMLAHAISQYYGFMSFSHNNSAGTRSTIIEFPQQNDITFDEDQLHDQTARPSESLSAFLELDLQ